MFPTAFEFRWDAGHMIFFGLFYTVVFIILTGLCYVVVKSLVDAYKVMRKGQGQSHAVESHVEAAQTGAAEPSPASVGANAPLFGNTLPQGVPQ
ncbi:hypothetical protein HZA56_09630 [Candidatus Poribacteria bacterium]|nr:hypothetical protein [Candidatus Poribacteria bacterium]